jgi:hypothetical protein
LLPHLNRECAKLAEQAKQLLLSKQLTAQRSTAALSRCWCSFIGHIRFMIQIHRGLLTVRGYSYQHGGGYISNLHLLPPPIARQPVGASGSSEPK